MTSDYGSGYMTNQYIRNCDPVCQQSGRCQYGEAITLMQSAKRVLDQARSHRVASEWCEIKTTELPDGHPFNGKAGKVVFERSILWPDGTSDHSGSITMCIKHGEETGLMPPIPKDPIGEIANGEFSTTAE